MFINFIPAFACWWIMMGQRAPHRTMITGHGFIPRSEVFYPGTKRWKISQRAQRGRNKPRNFQHNHRRRRHRYN